MHPIVVIDAAKKEYKRFVGRNVERHVIADELLTADDVEEFKRSDDFLYYFPDDVA